MHFALTQPRCFHSWIFINPVDRLTCATHATHCETILSSQQDITWNHWRILPLGEKSPEFIMPGNPAGYQTNDPFMNVFSTPETPWKIGRTNLTGRACSTAMLLQRLNSVVQRVGKGDLVGSHNPAQTLSGWMFELWISDEFEWFFTVNIIQ